uniref:Hadrucalcin n=1 Tax=Hoffmannihadrurus gertschi TaxID=380989 RepID=CAHAD_HOFGE|nr:RecName: Full=Hadrucalcin; Short=HdCa; Flags: Precursor [Hadrurus gertschi]ACC99422.1 hadrucalcin precursor [Hadrurus gertschi]
MKTSSLTIIFIAVIITIICLNIHDIEAREIEFNAGRVVRSEKDCIKHLQRCRENKDCCSKKCSRRGTNPEKRCR